MVIEEKILDKIENFKWTYLEKYWANSNNFWRVEKLWIFSSISEGFWVDWATLAKPVDIPKIVVFGISPKISQILEGFGGISLAKSTIYV